MSGRTGGVVHNETLACDNDRNHVCSAESTRDSGADSVVANVVKGPSGGWRQTVWRPSL